MAMVSHSLSLSKTHLHTKPSARRAFHVNNMSVNKTKKRCLIFLSLHRFSFLHLIHFIQGKEKTADEVFYEPVHSLHVQVFQFLFCCPEGFFKFTISGLFFFCTFQVG